MEGIRPAKGCPGLDSTAVYLCESLSTSGLTEGRPPREAKACRPDTASRRPRLDCGRNF